MKFYIHEANLERLHSKINRIRNKCAKYGCDFVYEELGEEFRVFNEGEDDEHVERFIIVEAEGTAVVHGWRFAATLDHTDTGNIIHKMIGDVEIPEKYYFCEPACEHCHSHRHRKNTYIVYNEETGEFKQVGSSCLNDFTNGLSAEAVAQYISLFDSLIEFEALPKGGSSKRYYEVDEILRYAVSYVNNIGYTSTQSYDISTKSRVLDTWFYVRGRLNSRFDEAARKDVEDFIEKFKVDFESDKLKNQVAEIKNHILAKDDESDYIHNLKVIMNSTYIDGASLGFAVSAVQCYRKDMERIEAQKVREAQSKKEAAESEYIGEVGERVVVMPTSVDAITSWDNQYGTTIRYKIVDTDGNVIMWDSSTYIDTDQVVESIKGTVKKLDIYNGVKQTWLTRCKVSYQSSTFNINGKYSTCWTKDNNFHMFVQDM